jgi:hypothetical protein
MFDQFGHDAVTLGNRSSQPLTIMYGGRQWDVPAYPGKKLVPVPVAIAGLNQHPVMGTENPNNPHEVEYLLYVEEWKKLPRTPREQSDKIERLDRSQLPPDRQNATVMTVAGRPDVGRPIPSPDNVQTGFEA